MLTLRRVTLIREGNQLLSNIDLTIGQGERLLILGPNGAGKTLLMQVAHRLIVPTQGEVINDAGPLREAMVFQRPVLLRRSVIANVLYAIDHAQLARRATAPADSSDSSDSSDLSDSSDSSGTRETPRTRLTWARSALQLVGLEALALRPAWVLSGGEQQRVALARAAALRPDLIWFDEPTANLDPASTLAIEASVMQMSRAGATCVMSTHDLGQAKRLAQRVLLMAGGKIIEATPAAQFFNEPATDSGRRYLRGELLNG